jgi:Fe-S-cluster-containing hydrogenase component 2
MKRFLLDLVACRKCDAAQASCKTDDPFCADIAAWREAAEFAVHCRQCRNAPCIAVCPAEALDWENDVPDRSAVKCVGCGSCALACPFGVILPEPAVPEVSLRNRDLETTEAEAIHWTRKCSKGGLRFGEFGDPLPAGTANVFPWLLARGVRWNPDSI